ncbi:MAG: tRNA (guanosine(37)-N1)-methyltransferase TrmD [Desulfovibrio sp.]|nr:tRNA (guanosine(37)-N1)-methyltransferase TrmD [Desulfovibrio sp.]
MPYFHIVTLFPEFFDSPLSTALMGRAKKAGLIQYSFHNPRQYSTDRHHHVDDSPYGGGPGMVMRVEPLARTLQDITRPGRMLLLTPAGRPFTQSLAEELAHSEDLTLICGRYEGIDARLTQLFPMEAVSIGDMVLNGGESAALAVLEAVARLTPGFMGKTESGEDESFSAGLLEYPHFTRPENLGNLAVPEVLLSGNHQRIAHWRRQQSLETTLRIRPELLDNAPLSLEDVRYLVDIPHERPGRNLSFCLTHYPVLLEGQKCGASSLTNLDIHDIARISCSYGMSAFYVATPLKDQLRVLEEILRHWTRGSGGNKHTDRALALKLVRPVSSLEEATTRMSAQFGVRPRLIASSATWPRKTSSQRPQMPMLTPRDVRCWCQQGPVMLCLGTARGLAPEALELCEGVIRPIRYLGYNHLSVRSAAAILADRILGDYF